MRYTFALLKSPVPYSIMALVAYLMFAPGAAGARSSSMGAAEGSCNEASCKPHNQWVCNIGGGDHENKCDTADTGC